MRLRIEIEQAIERCIQPGTCDGCLYDEMEKAARMTTSDPMHVPPICLDYLLRDALEALRGMRREEEYMAFVLPYEQLLRGVGHGWEETWLIGDDEDPERFDLEPCVWIDGHIMLASGSSADADSDHWREQYGRRYGMRVWAGANPPTEEQRRETPWGESDAQNPPWMTQIMGERIFGDPLDGKHSGLIAEE